MGFQGFEKAIRFGKDLKLDFKDLERHLNSERIWGGISKILKRFSIWKEFGMGFQRFGKDSRFGNDLGWDFNDLERIFALKRFGMGFQGFGKDS